MPRRKQADPLREYKARRHFEVTSEPSGASRARASPRPAFVVHKHDATRLHYDLRLEMEGALASWAIPKGPSYDPADKRLAVQTEDHPLEYGAFEGRIPDGEYGAGDSILWDRGTWDTEPPGEGAQQRRRGRLLVSLDGEKLKGRWHLIRTRPTAGGRAQWLCFKAKDGTERPGYDVIADRPESVLSGRRVTRGPVTRKALEAPHPRPEQLLERVWPPMHATLSTPQRLAGARWTFEVKYDGYRGLAAMSGGRLAFVTRNKLDLAERFPQLADALRRLVVAEAVIDGEVAAFDAQGVSRMQLLGEARATHALVAFDLLWLDGQDLRGRPQEERRELLESLLANAPEGIRIAERLEGQVEPVLAEAQRRGLEGVIAKRAGSEYEGKRSSLWLKLKVVQTQEVAIAGFTPYRGSRGRVGALIVAVRTPRGFEYAGKVGTGYTDKLRRALWRLLSADVAEGPALLGAPRERDIRWVTPRHVGQVAFSEWTRDGRMRHPSFHGLRPDKTPAECVREQAALTPPPARRNRPPVAARRSVDTLVVTSPDRLMYPADKIRKADVVAYYRDVAPVMVPALEGRPLTLQQWPQGIEREGFFRQSARYAPEWATTVQIAHGRRALRHLVVDRPETLEWLANQNALTLHIWASRIPHLDEVDWVSFDLDPAGDDRGPLVQIAHTLRGFLEALGLFSVPKTSGKRGLHVLVPLAKGYSHEEALAFARAITETLAAELPGLATVERSSSRRGGRLYLDALQNGRGKTLVAPYSLRAVPGAPVSTPLRWDEVTDQLDPARFTLKTLARRLDRVGDLFAPARAGGQRLPHLSELSEPSRRRRR